MDESHFYAEMALPEYFTSRLYYGLVGFVAFCHPSDSYFAYPLKFLDLSPCG